MAFTGHLFLYISIVIMSVKELSQNDIKLEVPHFTVDNQLHPQIPQPLPNKSHSMLFSGMPGSGKSSMMIAYLTQNNPPIYVNVFDLVYVFVPETSFNSMGDNPFKNHKRVYHDLNLQTITEVSQEIENNAKNGKQSLIILDDMAASLKNVELQRTMARFLCNRRHLKMSIWIVAQSYIQVPLLIRKTLSHFIIFRPGNKKEIMSITDEVNIDSKDFEKYMSYIFKPDGTRKDRAWMYIDDEGNIYNRFNLLSIE
jgi:hypothetical protein